MERILECSADRGREFYSPQLIAVGNLELKTAENAS